MTVMQVPNVQGQPLLSSVRKSMVGGMKVDEDSGSVT